MGGAFPKWETLLTISLAVRRLRARIFRKTIRVLERRFVMFNAKTLTKILAITCVLLAAMAATSAPASNNQPATGSDPAFKTVLQQDLSLKSELSPGLLPTLADKNPAPRHGFCRCSCGYPCTTSADCGGVSCDPFITCCDKEPQDDWFQRSAALSSHKGEMPVFRVKCK